MNGLAVGFGISGFALIVVWLMCRKLVYCAASTVFLATAGILGLVDGKGWSAVAFLMAAAVGVIVIVIEHREGADWL